MLFDGPPSPEANALAPLKLAISAEPGKAFTVVLGNDEISAELKKLLRDPKIPKAVHDYKSALRQLEAHGVELAGVRDEPMLYSYIINPTYTNHSLAEIAVRSFNLKLSLGGAGGGGRDRPHCSGSAQRS